MFVPQTGFADIILLLIVFLSTGRRGTFLSEEQIYNCAVVPSHNANSIKVKYLSNLPEINIGANLQIFLQKENAPFFRRIGKTYIQNNPRKSVPLKNKRPQTTQLNSNLYWKKNMIFHIPLFTQQGSRLIITPQNSRNTLRSYFMKRGGKTI